MKSSPVSGLNSTDLSPKRSDLKHQTTPLRQKRKTSRKDQASDVHSTCSTPNRLQSNISNSYLNSPSDSFPYSQENRPDVYWDFTSPQLPKGAKRTEIKLTVDEFLKCLSQHQVPECKSQSSNYIKLLEKWMTKQNTPVCVKQIARTTKRDNKKRSRRVLEEIRQFMESIKSKNEDPSVENILQGSSESNKKLDANTSNYLNISLDKKSFLEGDSTENDSTDDLWGDVDNSFIIKATQQLDVCSRLDLDKNAEIISTIPETMTSSSKECSGSLSGMGMESKINLNNVIIDPDYHAQLLLSQIIDYDWDSTSDFDEWENGFIEEDEALSLIPDEVLCGTDISNSPNSDKVDKNTVVKNQDIQTIKKLADTLGQNSECCSKNTPLDGSASGKVSGDKDVSQAELFDNFEDESFGEEDLLCKPEVLSWIDEVENKLSQSQKCTPEEIETKREKAMDKLSQSQKCTPKEIEKKKVQAIQRKRQKKARP